jgi:hypothetical protein
LQADSELDAIRKALDREFPGMAEDDSLARFKAHENSKKQRRGRIRTVVSILAFCIPAALLCSRFLHVPFDFLFLAFLIAVVVYFLKGK